MISDLSGVDTAKQGAFAYNEAGYTGRYLSVSFEGAFSINCFFTSALAVDGEMTLYYWNQTAYDSAEKLTVENAFGSITMKLTDADSYTATVTSISAKDIDSTSYIAGVYESDGVSYATGVLPYSVGAYCVDRINNSSGTMLSFAEATAVYGYYAKAYHA